LAEEVAGVGGNSWPSFFARALRPGSVAVDLVEAVDFVHVG